MSEKNDKNSKEIIISENFSIIFFSIRDIKNNSSLLYLRYNNVAS